MAEARALKAREYNTKTLTLGYKEPTKNEQRTPS